MTLIKSICLATLLFFTAISCTRADQEVIKNPPASTLATIYKCVPRDQLLSFLLEAAWEGPVAMGRTDSGELMEVLAARGGSWSMIITDDQGISCIKLIGHSWTTLVIINHGREASGRI